MISRFRLDPALVVAALMIVIAVLAPSRHMAAQDVSFNRDIRPILADKCFQCHGPDETSREADLRLDRRESAVEDRGAGAAIVPGDTESSILLERVLAADDSLRMPPPETKKRLTADEVDRLQRWIQQGARYEGHWAFLPIERPPVPDLASAGASASWAKNEIDRFILAKLATVPLSPSSLAEPSTQVRRLYLDLLGVLPPPAVVDAFAADPTDLAYSRLVDRLLADPRYGERWGRYWLDQARYADSHGYTIDGDRIMWPYRDWVLQALNRDMPFDQFTVEQLAGDLLPNPTKSQLVATGFHRNTLINQEGGTDDEQFRNEEVVDRVSTTGAVWLGLTLGCAQCHSHKFDPITQREFYELFAFFNNNVDVNNTGPTVAVHENEMFLGDLQSAADERLKAAREKVAELTRTRDQRQAAWATKMLTSLQNDGKVVSWRVAEPVDMKTVSAKWRFLEDKSVLVARGAEKETYRVRFALDEPTKIAAVRLRVIPDESLPKNGPGLAGNGNFVLTAFELSVEGEPLTIARAQASHHQPNFPIENAIDGKATSGWAINVAAGSKKKMNAPHEAHFVLAEAGVGASEFDVLLDHQANGSHYSIGRFAIDVASVAPAAVVDAELLTALTTAADDQTPEMQKLLRTEFDRQDAALRTAQAELAAAERALGYGAAVQQMVMRDRTELRPTYLLVRGDFLRPDKNAGDLTANVPGVFPPLPDKQGRPNRLDLARWLVSADHPLTSRVTVNRIWMRYFGRGLVETENDFGTQGTFPTHPALLDWLATQFMDDGWSVKSLHRRIVNSATYRQASHVRDDVATIDPLNYLLARQNRLRLDAEIVRDIGLSASGLLTDRIGGPSVRPPQPEGVYAFTQTKKNWNVDSGADRYRRAIYTRFYRSAPYPMLTTFDSPDFQSVCTARVRSNTPLQSLALANDAAQFEFAQHLAARILATVPTSTVAATSGDSQLRRHRVDRAYAICFSRQPSDAERQAIDDFLDRQEAYFATATADAKRITPPSSSAEGLARTAAWTAFARVLMNTDEFITRE